MSDHNLTPVRLTATGTVWSGPTRIRYIANGATAGTIVLRDGGASGTTILTMAIGAYQTLDLPGSIQFHTDCHATLTTVNNINFFV